MAARLVSVSVPHLLLLLIVVLVLAGSRMALQSMALLHELALSRQHIQATKHAPPADKPSRRACGQPNTPLGYTRFFFLPFLKKKIVIDPFQFLVAEAACPYCG
jgi:hypothetical protein